MGVLSSPLPGRLSADVDFLDNSLEFSRKITVKAEELRDMMCEHHELCNEEELGLIRKQLGLFVSHLDKCEVVSFNLEGCFSQIVSGLRDFHSLVRSLPVHLPQDLLTRLGIDIRDLLSNFREEMDTQGIMDVNFPSHGVPSYPSTFHEQAGTLLILSNLQKFMLSVQKALGAQ
ncbi:granulocyte colony-stimulating factor [Bombina bombina]|uniref:granulocyte colony-stimulating factor n=1 Tax=Bombina bombina TaxID=8345 RepID=UPI00235A7CD9|nr:granulocyte colony-stimulating factor [Bombina bombina]